MALAELAVNGGIEIPLLGICLGHQAIGLADGYGLIRDPNGAVHGTPVKCENDGSGLFQTSSKVDHYVRYNSLLINGGSSELFIANAFDEYGSIMGLRHKSQPIHTVQFHPESIGSPSGIEIIKSFLSLSSDA